MSSGLMEQILGVMKAIETEQQAQSESMADRMTRVEERLDKMTKDNLATKNQVVMSLNRIIRAQNWEALRWRELTWSTLPHTTRKGLVPFLSAESCRSLDSALTNSEARPHLVKSY